jgi:hypothetical protein
VLVEKSEAKGITGALHFFQKLRLPELLFSVSNFHIRNSELETYLNSSVVIGFRSERFSE